MDELKNANILVVGGAGFVGSNLVKAALRHGAASVVVVDNLLSAEKENLPVDDRVELIVGSITDDKVLAKLNDTFDYAFHLATFHGNQNSIADPLADHENNTFTTLKVCEHLKGFKKLKKLVYSSAGCTVAEKTYDDPKATTEDQPVSLYLDSPYQMSKIFGEFYVNYYFTHYGLPAVKARFQNVFGPGEVLGAGQWRGTPATIWRNVTPTFVYRGLKGMPLTVENGGQATRDFIYVDDIVEGLLACATRGKAGEVYNLASGKDVSILDLAKKVNELTGSQTPMDYLPPRTWDHSGKRYGSTDKAERELGFKCRVDFEEGLKRTVEWTKEHLPFIDKCIERHQAMVAQAR